MIRTLLTPAGFIWQRFTFSDEGELLTLERSHQYYPTEADAIGAAQAGGSL